MQRRSSCSSVDQRRGLGDLAAVGVEDAAAAPRACRRAAPSPAPRSCCRSSARDSARPGSPCRSTRRRSCRPACTLRAVAAVLGILERELEHHLAPARAPSKLLCGLPML